MTGALLLIDEPGQSLPGGWYAAAVVAAAVLGGLPAAGLAIVVSLLGVWFAVLEPDFSFSLSEPRDIGALVGFVLALSGLGYIVSRSEYARLAAAEAVAAAERGQRELDQVVSLTSVGVVRGEGAVVLDANEAFLAMTGSSRLDLIEGRLRFPLLEVIERSPQPEDRPTRRRTGTLGPVEVQMVDRAGDAVPVMVGGAISDPAQQRWMCFVVDLSQRLQLERALREAETAVATADLISELEEAQRIARLGSWSWDPESGMVTLSREMARILGLPPGATELPLDEGAELVLAADRDAMDVDALLNAGGFSVEQRIRRRDDGELRTIQLRGEVVDREDAQQRVRGTAQDVTDQRRTEQRLVRTRHDLVDSRLAHRRDLRVIEALQQAAIPESMPDPPELEIAGCYNPAGPLAMGGDWYDAMLVGDQHVALAVGDVAGHGVASAAVMVQLRNGLRAIALEEQSPGEALGRLNRLLCQLETDFFTTAVFAVYDLKRHTFTWSVAGHPAPVRFADRGAAVTLDSSAGGTVLGIWDDVVYTDDQVALDVGDGIWIYTDGLVESRTAPIDDGIETLVQAIESWPPGTSLGDLCNGMAEQLLKTDEPEDDVCQLVIRRRR